MKRSRFSTAVPASDIAEAPAAPSLLQFASVPKRHFADVSSTSTPFVPPPTTVPHFLNAPPASFPNPPPSAVTTALNIQPPIEPGKWDEEVSSTGSGGRSLPLFQIKRVGLAGGVAIPEKHKAPQSASAISAAMVARKVIDAVFSTEDDGVESVVGTRNSNILSSSLLKESPPADGGGETRKNILGEKNEDDDALDEFMASLPCSAVLPVSIARPQVITWEEIQSDIKTSAPHLSPSIPSSSEIAPEKQSSSSLEMDTEGVTGEDGGGSKEEEEYRTAFLAAFTGVSGAKGEVSSSESPLPAIDSDGVKGTLAPTADPSEDDDQALYAGEEWGEEISALQVLAKKTAKKSLPTIDHAATEYAPFRKAMYHPHPSVASMSEEAVKELRDDLEIKIRGKGPFPNPISSWEHTGLPDRLLSLLLARGYTSPFAIQRQALPIIMSGRDVFGVARTGSGKTLAYLLPLLRQVLDVPPLNPGEGPIGLILAPARELVTQIYHEARKLCKSLGLNVTAVYGGASVAEQIGALKRGGEIVVATPGRLIDLLSLSAGRLLSLKKVTYVVIDEADRMFDMGFEPQISRLLALVRPDRQMVMFSATFPKQVEALARKALVHSPCECIVGGRSKASPSITQWVEVRSEGDKFPRLLQLLGEWYDGGGGILIFVDTQEHCDNLWVELNKRGYPAAALHGGKDQVDREQTLADFKVGIRTLLVATSVAGRGLDVKHLVLVINYSCPNHLEDYVHRVGRTGRAGNKGTAFTFITPGEGAYAKDLVRALKDSKQEDHTPTQLTDLAKNHAEAVKAGTAKERSSGFASSKGGFKFDGSQLSKAQQEKRGYMQSIEREAGLLHVEEGEGGDKEEEGGGEEDIEEKEEWSLDQQLKEKAEGQHCGFPTVDASSSQLIVKTEKQQDQAQEGGVASASTNAVASISPNAAAPTAPTSSSATVQGAIAAALASMQKNMGSVGAAAGLSRAASLLPLVTGAPGIPTTAAPNSEAHRSHGIVGSSAVAAEELDINEYPLQARAKVLKEVLKRVEEATGAAVTCRGMFVPPGRAPPVGERRLHLLIEATNEMAVKRARQELRRSLDEETVRLGSAASVSHYAKYQV